MPHRKHPQIKLPIPSWFDRFGSWIHRLPGPTWLAYLIFGLLLFSVGRSILLLIGIAPEPAKPIEILVIFQIVYILTLIDFLNRRAAEAVETFRPILQLDGGQIQDLKSRLTTMPAKPVLRLTLAVSLLFIGLGVLIMNAPAEALDSDFLSAGASMFGPSAPGIYAYLIFSLLWLINAIFIYHTFHQLRAIDHAYTNCAEINLFRQTELYAFSRLSAATAIGFVLTSPVWIAFDPGIITLIINVAFSIMAIVIFTMPLLGAHRLLKRQKDALLKESSIKKEALIRDLFARLDESRLTEMGDLERALSSLGKAHDEIRSISTWPWQTQTIRQIVGALLLPTTIWSIQYFLTQLLTS